MLNRSSFWHDGAVSGVSYLLRTVKPFEEEERASLSAAKLLGQMEGSGAVAFEITQAEGESRYCCPRHYARKRGAPVLLPPTIQQNLDLSYAP